MEHSIVAVKSDDERLLQLVAELLEEEWPGKEKPGKDSPVKRRIERLRAQPNQRKSSYAMITKAGEHAPTVVGHFCLQKAVTGSLERSCAVSSVVVRKAQRGKGIGTSLMKLACSEAQALGYEYIYLWTEDAAQFYLKCGFDLCAKVNLFNSAVGKLSSGEVLSKCINHLTLVRSIGKLENTNFLDKLGASLAGRSKKEVALVGSAKKPVAKWMRKELRSVHTVSVQEENSK